MANIRRASPKEVIAIGVLLAQHYDTQAKDYRDGWDDKRIAAVVGNDISPASVANVRKSLGMPLGRGGNTRSGQIAAIVALQHQCTNLAIQVARVHWMLLDLLGTQRGPLLENRAKEKFPMPKGDGNG